MSRTYSAKNDKYQKHSKVNFQAYLNNVNEPQDNSSEYMPAELEAELLENSSAMRQKFLRLARRMRR